MSSKGGTVKLLSNAENTGLPVAEGSNIVLDLNGHKLEMIEPGTGSGGRKTIGLQLLKGSEVVIKNGTLEVLDETLKMAIQNYSNLVLDNVTVIGGPTIKYVVSNNFGTVVFKNGTKIIASEGNVAFDCYYGMAEVYDEGVNIIIADNKVKIDGKIEFAKDGRASDENFAANASITCPKEMDLNVDILNPPCSWIENAQEGTKTLRYVLADDNN